MKLFCNAMVGENVEAELLRKDFDAIVDLRQLPRDPEWKAIKGADFATDSDGVARRAGKPRESAPHPCQARKETWSRRAVAAPAPIVLNLDPPGTHGVDVTRSWRCC